MITRAALLALLALLTWAPSWVAAQGAKQVTPEAVRAAIEKGANYLKGKQGDSGSWEHLGGGNALFSQYKGGVSGLVMLALLEAGVPPEDPVIRKGLEY